VVPASSQYVDVLVDRVEKSNLHERLSVSRHLHDNVAHGIAAAIQRLQLSQRTEGAVATPSPALDQALSVLQETLGTVRDVATTLRSIVGSRNLDAALAELLEESIGYSGNIELVTSGNVGVLASHVKEEMFIILREGIRNALQHAVGMQTLRVGVETHPGEVLAYVEDDGQGFSRTPTDSQIGLQSMRERTELLGGSLAVKESKGEGCKITVRIPTVEGRPVVFA
jgi:signal transduction histidine kinase